MGEPVFTDVAGAEVRAVDVEITRGLAVHQLIRLQFSLRHVACQQRIERRVVDLDQNHMSQQLLVSAIEDAVTGRCLGQRAEMVDVPTCNVLLCLRRT